MLSDWKVEYFLSLFFHITASSFDVISRAGTSVSRVQIWKPVDLAFFLFRVTTAESFYFRTRQDLSGQDKQRRQSRTKVKFELAIIKVFIGRSKVSLADIGSSYTHTCNWPRKPI